MLKSLEFSALKTYLTRGRAFCGPGKVPGKSTRQFSGPTKCRVLLEGYFFVPTKCRVLFPGTFPGQQSARIFDETGIYHFPLTAIPRKGGRIPVKSIFALKTPQNGEIKVGGNSLVFPKAKHAHETIQRSIFTIVVCPIAPNGPTIYDHLT
jgi:hypothetical protein